MKPQQPIGLIQVFMKSPEAGKVKTRLIDDLGVTKATQIYYQLLRHIISVAQASDYPLECWVAGDLEHVYIDRLREQFAICEQRGTDLGSRMLDALYQGLASHQRVLLVGADAYSLTLNTINDAYKLLDQHDVVLGPAEDGGYILIAAKRLAADMFNHIDWGTDAVLEQQCRQLQRCQLTYGLLPVSWDIDRLSDIQRFAPELLETELDQP